MTIIRWRIRFWDCILRQAYRFHLAAHEKRMRAWADQWPEVEALFV